MNITIRLPSKRLIVRVFALVIIAISIYRIVVAFQWEFVTGLFGGIITFIGSFKVSDTPINLALTDRQKAFRDERNRETMLQKVQAFWVEGVLENSLHGAALIELGKEAQPEALEYPWQRQLQLPDQERRALPSEKRLVEVFEETGRALLILGAPGAGKTTMLLDLLRDKVAEARRDPSVPIPLVFNLSSWADKKQSLRDWLVIELREKYLVPARIGQAWVAVDQLLLLLDGFDEVKPELQDDCAAAINHYRQDHGMAGLVICSRLEEYAALEEKLRLETAVTLQPLTPAQVGDYLISAGPKLNALRAVYRKDSVVQELARSPLMLSVMTLAYEGMAPDELSEPSPIEERRDHLFATYVQHMFERRGESERYEDRKSVGWLSWLGERMSNQTQSVFLLERLQPSWLIRETDLWAYVMSTRLITGLLAGLGFALLLGGVGIGVSLLFGIFLGLIFGVGAGLVDGIRLGGARFRNEARNSSALRRSIRITLTNVLTISMVIFPFIWFYYGISGIIVGGVIVSIPASLISGLCIGSISGVLIWFLFVASRTNRSFKFLDLTRGHAWFQLLYPIIYIFNIMVAGAAIMLPFFLILGFGIGYFFSPSSLQVAAYFAITIGIQGANRALTGDIKTTEALSFSWSGMLMGGAIGMLLGFVIIILSELTRDFLFDIASRFDLMMIYGLVGALFGAVSKGIGWRVVQSKSKPNQGIHLSLRNAILAGAISALIGFTIVQIVRPLLPPNEFNAHPYFGLYIGLGLGLLAILLTGGLDVIQHYILRLILIRRRLTPRNYARFLDYSAKRILLRKVGGGYIFIHRMLMEYFAGLRLGAKGSEPTTVDSQMETATDRPSA